MNLRLDEELIRECEELAENENLDRSALIKKILIEGIQQERFNFAIKKYALQEISFERAAEIAKISIHELLAKITHLGISSNLTTEDFRKLI